MATLAEHFRDVESRDAKVLNWNAPGARWSAKRGDFLDAGDRASQRAGTESLDDVANRASPNSPANRSPAARTCTIRTTSATRFPRRCRSPRCSTSSAAITNQ